MIQSESSLEIAQPSANVFSSINDLSKAPDWLESCVQLTQTSSGPISQGTTLRYVYNQDGDSREMKGFVSKYENGKRLAFTFEDSQFQLTIETEVSRTSKGTMVKQAIEINPKGSLVPAMSKMIAEGNKQQIHRNLSRLKRLLESHES